MRVFVALAVIGLLAAPAHAETDWSRYGSFASTRCEDPSTISDILGALDGLTFDNGGGKSFANASSVEITQSTTLRATANLLDRRIRIEASEGGRTNIYNARHIVRIYPDGRWTTNFHPNY